MNINMTFVGQTIAFAFFVWFCIKFVWPPILGVMEQRQKKIAEGLDAADRAERELENAQEKVDELLQESKEQAAGILDKANKAAANIIEESKQKARTEGEKLVAKAKAEIDLELNQIKDQLRMQVSNLAVLGAEKILESTVDAAAHEELVNKIASKLL